MSSTSFSTILVLLALFWFGGENIHGFATALLIGVGIGIAWCESMTVATRNAASDWVVWGAFAELFRYFRQR